MILRRFTLVMFLLAAPAVWAQYSRADMIQLAADRCDTIGKKLNLSPNQITAIQPLLQSKYIDMGAPSPHADVKRDRVLPLTFGGFLKDSPDSERVEGTCAHDLTRS